MTQSSLSSRRTFLKTAGAAGTALVGGLAARVAPAKGCDFSALPPGFVYLNNGTEGTMPDCVLAVLQDGLQQWASDPTTSYETDPVLGKHQVLNRSKVGTFLGTEGRNICLTDNTTMGLGMTLMGLDFQPGDRVVTTNHEHTAIKSPLRLLQQRIALQVVTRSFPAVEKMAGMSTAELLDALFPRSPELNGAKALCVTHVYPTTGVRLPLRALREKADELGIQYLIIDGAQALGMLDLTSGNDNINNSDFYACPGHKWLNGPPSTGVLYIRNADIRPPEFYPTLSQRMEKYDDCNDESESCFSMTEALQVRGCHNAPGFAAMLSAMQIVENAGGAAKVEEHILGMSRNVKDLILDRAPHCMVSPQTDSKLLSGITAFFPFNWNSPKEHFRDKETADRVVSKLLKKNVQVRSIGFSDGGETVYALRVSTGHFNSANDVETFEAALRDVLSG